MKASQELDPLSLIISGAIGWANYMDRRYEDAIEQLRRTAELEPNYSMTYWILGLILRKMGRYEQAIRVVVRAAKPDDSPACGQICYDAFSKLWRRRAGEMRQSRSSMI